MDGGLGQFRLATQASMDSGTVSVAPCFGRSRRAVRALSIDCRGGSPEVFEGRVSVLGIDAGAELVHRHDLQLG